MKDDGMSTALAVAGALAGTLGVVSLARTIILALSRAATSVALGLPPGPTSQGLFGLALLGLGAGALATAGVAQEG